MAGEHSGGGGSLSPLCGSTKEQRAEWLQCVRAARCEVSSPHQPISAFAIPAGPITGCLGAGAVAKAARRRERTVGRGTELSCTLEAGKTGQLRSLDAGKENLSEAYCLFLNLKDTGLYYDEYLKQVIDVLETDNHFREKLQKADIEEIKSGRLSKELDLVSHHVRTKLDELKRQEVGRLRMLIKAKLDSLHDTGIDYHALLKQFDHLNHMNPDKFESTDLDMLIKAATSDLENYDKTRHEEFKKYEMMKEHERREYLKTLNEEKRKEEESKFEEMKKKHENHPKVNHPGSKDQLKEVWEEADGLDPNDFDPKTFFKLHDVNNDGFLDEQELEALFTKELEKVYDPKNEEDDMVEMEEERLRMREHVMNETLDQQQFFTEEELKEYENMISLQENELKKKADELQKQKEELQRQHDQLEAQKLEYHQVIQQMEQKKLQQEISPSGPGGESKFEPRM
ncbi:hypothetical protein QTO34_003711 [Cnephaeus nilssonii]|uniref:EF-hand domain-containing protein n=1 Tax=Cnephaeus nilssonii TaxID=3371016 RepID=A0AA40LKS8_CNENI|nr:hypothetical protein QTO34_003711 [Eptesicus nilssonii]